MKDEFRIDLAARAYRPVTPKVSVGLGDLVISVYGEVEKPLTSRAEWFVSQRGRGMTIFDHDEVQVACQAPHDNVQLLEKRAEPRGGNLADVFCRKLVKGRHA